MFPVYSALLALAAVFAAPWLLVRGVRRGKYLHSFRARMGHVPEAVRSAAARGNRPIWLHAVSVGELLACQKLVTAIRERFADRPLVISTTTLTGFQTAEERMGSNPERPVAVFYCPFDFVFAVRRVLRSVRPAMLIIAETEFWPNLFGETERAGVPIAVVNARVSDRSFPRYRRLRFFFRRVLDCASVLLAQSQEDARRLVEIGAPAAKVSVAGNLKYDTPPPRSLPEWLDAQLRRWSAGGVLLAGSTAAGEDDQLLVAFAHLRLSLPSSRLIVAPRRPERFDEVFQMATSAGFRVARRSHLAPGVEIAPRTDVLLLDTIGELGAFYRFATVAFVGGSLVPHGGQNILEPAQFARPIVVGPHMHNFREMTRDFLRAGAIRQVHSGAELADVLERLFRQPEETAAMGNAAWRLLDANRGATARVVEALAGLLEQSAPTRQTVAASPERQA